jgi:tyrosyl-tRNA synthetase
LRVNDVAVTDVKASVSLSDLTDDRAIKLSVGKKKHALVKPI